MRLPVSRLDLLFGKGAAFMTLTTHGIIDNDTEHQRTSLNPFVWVTVAPRLTLDCLLVWKME